MSEGILEQLAPFLFPLLFLLVRFIFPKEKKKKEPSFSRASSFERAPPVPVFLKEPSLKEAPSFKTPSPLAKKKKPPSSVKKKNSYLKNLKSKKELIILSEILYGAKHEYSDSPNQRKFR